ncbi:GAF domain-containing protein [Pontibacter ummariensis]|uniref:histidine kinase n=1 Tax=Pontibacter ummariensis TaxID=1610492 RepID=A0A239KTL0_9BACT|nr:GAF domain-containing sensor histidine kinase [Pontibacter ummariensis]PRY05027.1 GAF domain-containing protein [Pontibacter ummariensis]SNT21360.1 GAF domain-containing protein [Pontibacter ummariensis]
MNEQLHHLAQELEQERRQNDFLRRLSVELSQLASLKEKLDNILAMLDLNFQLKHSMLLLPDREQHYLSVFASRGFEEQGLGARVKMGEGVIGVVALRKRRLRMANISRQRQYLQAAAGIGEAGTDVLLPGLKDVESQVAIPLLSNDELVAVLSVESRDHNFFSPEDEAFLMTLSQLLAISIQNAVILEQLEQKVQERTAELVKLNASKDRLFSIIGHDLRSPAAALQHVAELIQYYHEKGNVQQLLELGSKTARAASGINSMLDNLLNWSLSQTGDLQLQIEPLAVYPLLQDVVELHDEFAFSKNISIGLSGLEDAEVMADKNALLTILRNLLSNAIKFTRPGGAVTIEVKTEDDRVRILFRDNGIGISPERMKILFDLHHPKSSKGTAKEKGTGLGMVLVKELLEKTGGEIEVLSHLEEGTTVILRLPACSSLINSVRAQK